MLAVDMHDEKPEAPDRLCEANLLKLAEFLQQRHEQGGMDIEEVDGFFTALHCCPELVPPSEYLPVLLGDEDEAIFDSLETASEF
jgi:uncharacterized protein